MSAGAYFLLPRDAGAVATGAFALLLLLPQFLFRAHGRALGQHRLGAARLWALPLSVLLPTAGWVNVCRLLSAELARERGDLEGARARLQQLIGRAGSDIRLRVRAEACLLRLDLEWERLAGGFAGNDMSGDSLLVPLAVQTLGETRQTEEMAAWLRLAVARGTLSPYGRMIGLAFCGRSVAVAQLLQGPLRHMGSGEKAFWRATVAMAAGGAQAQSAAVDLQRQVQTGSIWDKLAALDRLAHPPDPMPSEGTGGDRALIAMLETGADGGTTRLPRWHSLRRALARSYAVLAIVLVTAVVYGAEMLLGGAENEDTLYRLGALAATPVLDGEYWRLVTPLFLHYGPLHFGLNMLVLLLLGARVETSLGHWRTLVVYMGAGIGSNASVLLLMLNGYVSADLLVGASGAIFGIVGAQIVLLLRDWRWHRSTSATHRLQDLGFAILIQAAFDLSTPEVSFSGHGSGLVAGMLLTTLLLVPAMLRARR